MGFGVWDLEFLVGSLQSRDDKIVGKLLVMNYECIVTLFVEFLVCSLQSRDDKILWKLLVMNYECIVTLFVGFLVCSLQSRDDHILGLQKGFVGVMLGVCSEAVRKKGCFSEQLPNNYRTKYLPNPSKPVKTRQKPSKAVKTD